MDNFSLNDESVTAPSALTHCINCNEPINPGSRFCGHCGFAQANAEDESGPEKLNALGQVAVFFLIDAAICCIASFINFFKTLQWSITVDILLAITAIVFFWRDWRNNKSLLRWANFSIFKLLGYCSLAVVASFVVSISVRSLNRTLFSKELSYYAFYEPHKHAKALAIFFIAIMPALFEELGYRGFLLGKLLQVVDKKQAIFISAFLFAIMHTSFISLFWLIPFALLLAAIRLKENTLWYGVFIHFSFNFTVCVTEILRLNHYH